MISDQSVGLAAKVVSGTPKDTLHFVDLLYNPDGSQRLEVLITDQGSYSDIVFGLVTLLGFDYRPVLADLPDAKLWRINGSADYGRLDRTARGKIDVEKVRRHWPDICRIAASIHTREVSAHDVIRILQRDGRPTDLGDAVAHYGRIFKTLHVLTFVDDPAYRREMKAMRNLQEGRHALARHIFHGREGKLHQAYRDGQEDQLGALGLVLNCVTLWNTVYLDHALTVLREQGYPCSMPMSSACRRTCAGTSTSTATTPSNFPTSPAAAALYAIPTTATATRNKTPEQAATSQPRAWVRGRDSEVLSALKVLSGFDADLTHECTRAINRLRSLLQIFPGLERAFPGTVLVRYAGPAGLRAAGRSNVL